ncbi:unnamed protein product [Onchocerca flexuosa]|uniref:Neur_chan_memb domain-containing protein n=1 Tax=Onchocerca flexuosa TaxID=387005 RepID=A0A183HVP8_9BILA|nr:unnamed protein product [Onchocerca flexuosa]
MDVLHETIDYGPNKKHLTIASYRRDSKLHRISDFMYFTIVLPVGAVSFIYIYFQFDLKNLLC